MDAIRTGIGGSRDVLHQLWGGCKAGLCPGHVLPAAKVCFLQARGLRPASAGLWCRCAGLDVVGGGAGPWRVVGVSPRRPECQRGFGAI